MNAKRASKRLRKSGSANILGGTLICAAIALAYISFSMPAIGASRSRDDQLLEQAIRHFKSANRYQARTARMLERADRALRRSSRTLAQAAWRQKNEAARPVVERPKPATTARDEISRDGRREKPALTPAVREPAEDSAGPSSQDSEAIPAEPENGSWTKIDLSAASAVRLAVDVATAGASGAELCAQYSLDQSKWYDFDNSAGPCVDVASTGTQTSSWVELSSDARREVFVEAVVITDDGGAEPEFSLIDLQYR